MNPKPSTMTVDLGDRSYDILVGKGLLSEAGSLIQPLLAEPRVVIITDEIVEKQWLKTLISSLDAAGISHECIVLEAGEKTKDYAHAEDLMGKLLDARVERSTTLIALGGGVIGDITGFAAAITLRLFLFSAHYPPRRPTRRNLKVAVVFIGQKLTLKAGVVKQVLALQRRAFNLRCQRHSRNQQHHS